MTQIVLWKFLGSILKIESGANRAEKQNGNRTRTEREGGMTNAHGGRRANSGRKHTYGNMPTKRIARTIPEAWIAELDQWLLDKRAKDDAY